MNETTIHKVLGDRNRLNIINSLKDIPRSAGELVEICQTSKSNLSQHLKVLLDSGIVERERRGRQIFYFLTDAFKKARNKNVPRTVNESLMANLLLRAIEALYKIEKARDENGDVKKAYGFFVNAMHAYIQKAWLYGLPHPKKKGDYFSFFTKNANEYHLAIFVEWTSGGFYPVIDPSIGRIHSFWIDFLEENDTVDSEESNNFLTIREMIRLREGDRDELMTAFINLRQLFSDPKKPAFYSGMERNKLLKPFTKVPEIYQKLFDFFEEVHTDSFALCPHCQRPFSLQELKEKRRFHWRCNLFLLKAEERGGLETVSVGTKRYFKLTDWVVRFIRIPGLEEERIGEKTSGLLSGEEAVVEMNPDGDRVDILVHQNGTPVIQGDVKDYQYPYSLAKKLNDYNENKKGKLDEIHIIIPQDTIKRTPDDYVATVKRLLNPDKHYLNIVSEAQWYKLVRKTIRRQDEL